MGKLISAGLLMYRRCANQLEVLLAHPGGPYFVNQDLGAWTIPKGLINPQEDPLAAAQREFQEETSLAPQPPFLPLKPVKQKGGKTVQAWAFEGNCDPSKLHSNTYKVQWPPKSGRWSNFPEVDRCEFFDLPTAREKINAAQVGFLDELEQLLKPQEP